MDVADTEMEKALNDFAIMFKEQMPAQYRNRSCKYRSSPRLTQKDLQGPRIAFV